MGFMDVIRKVSDFGEYLKGEMGIRNPNERPSPETSPDPHTRASAGARELREAMEATAGGDTRKNKKGY